MNNGFVQIRTVSRQLNQSKSSYFWRICSGHCAYCWISCVEGSCSVSPFALGSAGASANAASAAVDRLLLPWSQFASIAVRVFVIRRLFCVETLTCVHKLASGQFVTSRL